MQNAAPLGLGSGWTPPNLIRDINWFSVIPSMSFLSLSSILAFPNFSDNLHWYSEALKVK
jgi:hypothetical protein